MPLIYDQDVLHFDGLSLSSLAEEFGTPLYVYSQPAMIAAARQMDMALAGRTPHTVCYALKANPSLAVVQTFARLGFGADVTSGGELFRALRAGVPPERIVFSGVGKSSQELRDALAAGIHGIHVESEQELRDIDGVAAGLGLTAPVALRVNPNIDPHTHPKIATGLSENKFGLPWGDVPRIVGDIGGLPHIRLCGLSMHIGSQLTRLDAIEEAARLLAGMAHELLSGGAALDYLDLGGGLGVRYAEETPPSSADWARVLRAALGDLPLALLVEPGRALVAEAGLLLSRVVGIKHTASKTFIILDTGMNDFIRPMLYDAYHPIWPVTRRSESRLLALDLVGPLCETTDTLARDRSLALPEAGDLLAILQAGAYGMSMASNYNSRPRPAEVLIVEGDARLIRTRESTDDLVRGETLLP